MTELSRKPWSVIFDCSFDLPVVNKMLFFVIVLPPYCSNKKKKRTDWSNETNFNYTAPSMPNDRVIFWKGAFPSHLCSTCIPHSPVTTDVATPTFFSHKLILQKLRRGIANIWTPQKKWNELSTDCNICGIFTMHSIRAVTNEVLSLFASPQWGRVLLVP